MNSRVLLSLLGLFGKTVRYDFKISVFCSPRLHLFDIKKYGMNIVKYYCILK